MELKPFDIVLIVIAIAVPVALAILAFTPGGFAFVIDFALNPSNMPWVFFGGAAILFSALCWRLYRRIRPKETKAATRPAHISPTRMPKVEGSEAVRRARERAQQKSEGS